MVEVAGRRVSETSVVSAFWYQMNYNSQEGIKLHARSLRSLGNSNMLQGSAEKLELSVSSFTK